MAKVHNPLRRPSQRTDAELKRDEIDELDPERFEAISIEEGKELLEEQAQKHLNMSGEEFARRYHAGEFEDPCQSEVIRVSYLLSFAEGPKYDRG